MTVRTLTFGAGDNAKFILFWNAFQAGGNQVHRSTNGQRPVDDRRKEAKVMRALKAISIVLDDTTGSRKLASEGGTFSVEQPAFVLIEKYLAEAPLPTEVSDELDALMEWVSLADKLEGS